MSERIEVVFTPSAADYACATRWVTRQALARWYLPYLLTLAITAFLLALGAILLVDAALAPDNPYLTQAKNGIFIFLLAGYALAFSVLLARRFLRRRLYSPDGIFLTQRTMILEDAGVTNRGGIFEQHIIWSDILEFGEDRANLYFRIEPAYALFLPKRVIASRTDLDRLKDFIRNKLENSKPEH